MKKYFKPNVVLLKLIRLTVYEIAVAVAHSSAHVNFGFLSNSAGIIDFPKMKSSLCHSPRFQLRLCKNHINPLLRCGRIEEQINKQNKKTHI